MVNIANPDLAEDFTKQSIARFDPNFDLTGVTPFHNLFVSFFRFTTLPDILALYADIIDSRSLLNTNVSNAVYDKLLANWNFQRKSGTKTATWVRSLFSEPTQLNITTTDRFIINDITFMPRVSRTYFPSDFTTEVEGVWYFDILVESLATGAATNVGTSVAVDPPFSLEPGYLSSFTTVIDAPGADTEPNDIALQRLSREFGLETLVNIRGINFVLSKYFPNLIFDSYIAGYSEVEQRRDIVTMEIPKRIARVFFTEKFALSIPANAVFYYNSNSAINYRIKGGTILSVPADSPLWQEGFHNDFYLDIEVELTDYYNPENFKEDSPVTVPYLSLTYPTKFLGGHTKTNTSVSADIRVGGHTDLYIRTPVVREKVKLFVPVDSHGFIQIPPQYQPLLKIHGIQEIGSAGSLVDVEVYELIIDDPRLRFSARDNVSLFVKPSLVGVNILVDMTYAPVVRVVQSFVDLPGIRVIAEDLLVRFFNPVFVGIFMAVSGSPGLESLMKTTATVFVNSILSGSSMVMSDLVSKMGSDVPALRAVFFDSIHIMAQQMMPDGSVVNLNGDNIITPEEDVDLGVSIRNTVFLMEAIEIKFD